MRTSVDRIERDITELARFSQGEGAGCTRLTYTKEFAAARDYIIREMEAVGLEVREDAIGTIIGRLKGENDDEPVVMTGSHFDTVLTGGRFDGIAGVTAALETARVMYEEGFVPLRPIEFVALPEEEGARFGSGLFGSRAICGKLMDDELEHIDNDGVTLADAMREYGLDPSKVKQCSRDVGDIDSFVELHIEQGPLLETTGINIGIVEQIVGIRTVAVTIKGRSDHAGNTPMDMRADAMLAAAKMIVAATSEAVSKDDGTVATCGDITIKPKAFNIVASEVVLKLDCRGRCIDRVEGVLSAARASLEDSVRNNRGLSYEMEEILHVDPTLMDEGIKEKMRESADEAGITYMDMLSGAGHDAMVMSSIAKAAMIFVPSKGGRSHVPEEWTDYEELQKGVEVVYLTVKKLASK